MRRPVTHPLALRRLRDARLEDGSVDPLAAAIAIATHARPRLSIGEVIEKIEGFAREVRAMAAIGSDGEAGGGNAMAGVANHVLFDRHGFRGNRERYGDPQNSYIDCVLKQKTGLPILLSLIYVETVRRAGGVAHGIGLPGHIVAAVDEGGRRVLVDAFDGGKHLTVDDCRKIAEGAGASWSEEYLEPVDGRKWVMRMLANLRNVYAQMGDAANLAAVVEQMILLAPEMGGLQEELARVYGWLDEQAAKNN